MSDTTRKPRMSADRHKILNLLEYILEVDTTIDTVYNAFVLHVSQVDEDLSWEQGLFQMSDETWAQWFEEYAENLSNRVREANRVDSA